MFHYTEDTVEVPVDVTHVLIASSVSKIPAGAFKHCWLLREVFIVPCPPSSKRQGEEDKGGGLQEIGETAFFGCRSLASINIPPSVKVVRSSAFTDCRCLKRLAFPEGLIEIQDGAFENCSLEQIKLPSTLRTIGRSAFAENLLVAFNLPDSLESIGPNAFQECEAITCARIPPLVTTLPEQAMHSCLSMFNLELPEGIERMAKDSLANCDSLRNVFIPPNAKVSESFDSCYDLWELFGSSAGIIEALTNRFDGLPVHKLLYYQSYHSPEAAFNLLRKAINLRSGQSRRLRIKLDLTGKEQDCLGMTPLHILACSRRQNLDLYKMIIDAYPENLITEDRWGELPMFYAAWGSISEETMLFLAQSLKSRYPTYRPRWGRMIKRLSMSVSGIRIIHNLVEMYRRVFADCGQIDWNELLDEMAAPKEGTQSCTPSVFRCLILYGMRSRMRSIPIKKWQFDIRREIASIPSETDDFEEEIIYVPDCSPKDSTNTRRAHLDRIRAKVAAYEREYRGLKEATTVLELAVWQAIMNESKLIERSKRSRKRIKLDDSCVRNRCRISCGADIVIENVLPYLIGS